LHDALERALYFPEDAQCTFLEMRGVLGLPDRTEHDVNAMLSNVNGKGLLQIEMSIRAAKRTSQTSYEANAT